MDTLDVIETIEQDFQQRNEPFNDVTFPEERLLENVKVMVGDTDEPVSLSMEDRLRLISAFATFDYNRDANQLVDKLLVLQKQHSELFDPWNVPESTKTVEQTFDEIGFRYPNRDAQAWTKNCRILRQKYHGRWHELLIETGLDAVSLVSRLEDDDFNCIKGVKIAPMYCRIINDKVTELDKLWELDIPVDTWVRKISKELFEGEDEDLSDDDLRDRWYLYGVSNSVDKHVVDGGIWQIGNNLNEWGGDYLKELLEVEELEHL
jgi:hypothetical protein